MQFHEMGHMWQGSRIGLFPRDPHCTWAQNIDHKYLHGLPFPSSSQNFQNHHFNHDSSNSSYSYPSKNLDNHQSVGNMESGSAAPLNPVHHPSMFSSTGRVFSDPFHSGSSDQIPNFRHHGVLGPGVIEQGGTNQFFDGSWSMSKRKSHEDLHVINHHVNGVTDPSRFSNSGIQRNMSSEARASSSRTPDIPLYEDQIGLYPIGEGFPSTACNQIHTIFHQHEPPLAPSQGHFFQGNYAEPSFQPGNLWKNQFGNHFLDCHGYSWNYMHTRSVIPGPNTNRGPEIETPVNTGYTDSTARLNFATHLYSLPALDQHQHVLQAPGVHNRINHHHQLAVFPYGHPHPVNPNMHHGVVQPSRDVMNIESTFSPPHSYDASDNLYDYLRHSTEAVPAYNDVLMEMLPAGASFVPYSSSPDSDNANDQHRDMRLDIDSMSYEELLDLQEQIGDVNTGLSEETIIKHLRTRTHLTCTSLSLSIQPTSSRVENENCTICQVDFEEKERLGSLDCGHEYHTDCIKQWLMVKNICPICKTTGLNVDELKGVQHRNGYDIF